LIKNINNLTNIFIIPSKKDSNCSLDALMKKKRIRRNLGKSSDVSQHLHMMTEDKRFTEQTTPTKNEYFFTFYND
jgi:hypothetical protein